ncbi:MAG: SAM hydrolase/SAM-dependent halogenase family protein [Acidimicrobiales bacterium]
MPPRFDTVSFLSDYGLEDEFVGVVKAVIRSLAPHVTVLDITHSIPAHDVRAGALALARSIQYLPPGIVMAIVDPGVGSDRRAVAVEVGGANGGGDPAVLLGPDNGLLASGVALAGGAKRAVSLTNDEYHLAAPGPTFAGRDIFAPAAAHLANGVDLAELGEAVDPFSLLPGIVPLSREEEGALVGEVLWVDRFGNAQLNMGPDDVEAMGDRVLVRIGDKAPRLALRVTNYAALKAGQVGLVVDSYGLLSVALNRRSAADELKIGSGDAVTLQPAPE